MTTKIIESIVGVVGIMALIVFICTLPTLWLWNWLIPVIFGLPCITFWQAFGLNLLTSILFKSTTVNKS